MGNICPCPKRNTKKQFPYDVHEETFEMEDNIHNIGQNSPKNEHQDNNILTEDLRMSDYPSEKHQLNEIKTSDPEIQHSNNTEPESIVLEKGSADKLSSNNVSTTNFDYKQEHQLLPPLQPITQSVPELPKPSFHANILKPKAPKKKYNPDDYRFINEDSAFKVKKIDSIKQQQYNIENCTNCQYFIFDITANLYIDDCSGCFIYIAPCQSTIFIRNCKNMTLVAATKQFRTFECHNSTFSLYCKSQPVIESSSNLQFTSFKCQTYAQLFSQFTKKKLEPWNNHWSEIHNFTKKIGEVHYSLHEEINIEADWKRAYQQGELQIVQQQSPIPFMKGDIPYEPTNEIIIDVSKEIQDDEVRQTLRGAVILRAFQGVVMGEGKQERRLILLDALDFMVQKFQPLGKVTSDPAQVNANKAKYFIIFSDEREK